MTLQEFREREERWILAQGEETFSELDEAEAERELSRKQNEYAEWSRRYTS